MVTLVASSTLTVAASMSSTSLTASPTCTTAVPDKNGYVPPDSCNANYGFYPQWEDNVAFAIAFGLATAAHLAQAIILKKPFCWVIIMGALWECVCFVLRALGAKDQQESLYVTLSTLLFLLAPLWINAFAYMVVARLIYFLQPEQKAAGIPARWLAKGFVTADVVCFIVQAAGGAMMADQNNSDAAKTGRNIYMVGVGVQLAFVLVFLVVAVCFHRDMLRNRRTGRVKSRDCWTAMMIWVIYAVLVLIIERIIFRLIEFSQGVSSSNAILRHEAYQLYLDALPMLLAIAFLNIVHPGMVLKGPGSSFPSSRIRWWRGRSAAFEPLALQSLERQPLN
ncbi:RTA1 domain-containingprotein [Purpureocillium lavendulum]|uniref:RTA1 domain-containingprotein n=1 Tax=Purpureocillium lavendulum TaxID=1247861 RepID=A0AB34G125_9HYPO|nr:RTA1 domain-containingprotein [Purpureocillium lavendulum]